MSKILTIKCPDGFGNQLRLLIAANFLVKEQVFDKAIQECVVNNHNIVNFIDFFEPLDNVIFENLDDKQVMLNSNSYTILTKNLCEKKGYSIYESFRQSFNALKLKEPFKNIISKYINQYNIKNCIGVHLRTGCKTALLSTNSRRHQPISHEIIIDILKNTTEPIYLATDNAETQDKFINTFKDRILFFEKINDGKEKFDGLYNRENVKRFTSPFSVIADFHILKECKYFIGSNESSFSLIIKTLRNNPYDYKIYGKL
jgi:hypothetical protein